MSKSQRTFWLNATVFLTGAGLMTVELVASRYRKKLEAGRRDLVVAALMRRGFAYPVIRDAIQRVEQE